MTLDTYCRRHGIDYYEEFEHVIGELDGMWMNLVASAQKAEIRRQQRKAQRQSEQPQPKELTHGR